MEFSAKMPLKPQRLARLACLPLLGLACLALAACGSRTWIEDTSDLGDVSPPPGAGGYSGTTTGSGGTSSPGQAGDLAPSPCSTVACSDIDCGPGFASITLAGDCCPTCQPAPCGPCALPVCPSGYQPQTLPGQCCPTCAPGVTDACQRGQDVYSNFRTMLFDRFKSTDCRSDKDCTLFYEVNRCVSNCGVPLPTVLSKYTEQDLQSFANQSCVDCPPPLAIPCPAASVFCTNGRCSF